MNVSANAAKTYTDGTQVYVPLRRIVDSTDIPYRDLDSAHVNELTESIGNSGLHSPLLVWNGGGEKGTRIQLGEDGDKVPATYLVAGAHRRAALKALFKKDVARFKELFPNGVPCFVMGGELSDVLTAQLRENVMRKDMPAEQVFPVLKRLLGKTDKGGLGLSQSEVAKRIGKSKGWVSQILSIEEELGEEAVEALKKKEIGLSEARAGAKTVKDAKKSGKAVDAKAVVTKLKEKAAKRKASGKTREAKRLSARVLWKRYGLLPRRNIGDKVAILEGALGYLAGDENAELPSELASDAEDAGDEKE